jgi:hypothetical protein
MMEEELEMLMFHLVRELEQTLLLLCRGLWIPISNINA